MVRLILFLFVMIGMGVPAAAADLTLKRVMLSSGGVGYFEYAADVDGDDTLGLDVPLGQVDDILKSLVVFDGAGGVAGVELPGRDNAVQAFGDAPFGPEALDSPIAYLNALKGAEITVQGPRPMTGRIVRAEPEPEKVETLTVRQRTRVTLLSADGLRQFVLEDADSVQIVDPALRARIERALDALRRDSSLTTRHLTVHLKGKGRRLVAVGYVAGAPLWKATYRLMLAPSPATSARLQGWATLENQSGADWKGVTLTLQYGNPVTFRQSLYRSYFVQRPEVPVEILGRVLPTVDTRADDARPAAMPQRSMGGFTAEMAKSRGIAAPAPAAPPPPPEMAAPAEAAQAHESAEETIFTLARPVDLAAGHSANVPIIDREVPAPRISLVPFHQTHPLAAVRVKNNGGQSLPAGVLTLYDSTGVGGFVGDARLGGLPVGESRLLSFARDLRTTIETTRTSPAGTLTSFSVADGVLTFSTRNRQIITITAIPPANEARDVLLEIPKSGSDEALTFADGKSAVSEQTATAFRVAASLRAGETKTFVLWLDEPTRESVNLVDVDDTVLQSIVGAEKLNPSGRAAIGRIVELRGDEARKRAEVEKQRKLLADVQADEDRIRKNLGAVSAGDALRTRLTRALDADETKIEQLRKAIDEASAEAENAHRALVDAVTKLRI